MSKYHSPWFQIILLDLSVEAMTVLYFSPLTQLGMGTDQYGTTSLLLNKFQASFP